MRHPNSKYARFIPDPSIMPDDLSELFLIPGHLIMSLLVERIEYVREGRALKKKVLIYGFPLSLNDLKFFDNMVRYLQNDHNSANAHNR